MGPRRSPGWSGRVGLTVGAGSDIVGAGVGSRRSWRRQERQRQRQREQRRRQCRRPRRAGFPLSGRVTPRVVDGGHRYRTVPEPRDWHILPTGVMGMPTRNVVLSQHQHELVEQLVESGQYQNASEVLREGLRLLERRNAEDAARLAALRAAADQGWADVAAGRFVDVDDADLDGVIADIGARAVADGRSSG